MTIFGSGTTIMRIIRTTTIPINGFVPYVKNWPFCSFSKVPTLKHKGYIFLLYIINFKKTIENLLHFQYKRFYNTKRP